MKVIKTILRAFVLGIGVGVLLAPRAGSETRRLLSEKFNSALDSASNFTDQFSQSSTSDSTSDSVVPSQHYVQSSATREVGSADTMTM